MEELIKRIVELSADTVQTELYELPEFQADTSPDEVSAKFKRPDAQLFYGQFNPQMVVLSSFWGDMTLYDFASLDKRQDGYSVEGKARTPVEDWPEGMLVIGECSVDPIMLDPDQQGEIMYAIHGQGDWEPLPIAADIEGLLKLCVAWLETVRQRGEDLRDETLAYRDESIELFMQLARDLGIEQSYLDNVMELA